MDLNELHDFIIALWAFMKKYSDMPVDWEKAVREASELHRRWGSSHAKHEMILDAIEILREEDRKHVH